MFFELFFLSHVFVGSFPTFVFHLNMYSCIVFSPSLSLSPFFSFLIFLQLSFHLPCNISLSISIVCLESYLLLLVALDVFPMPPNVPHCFFDVIQYFPNIILPSSSSPKVSPTSLIVL